MLYEGKKRKHFVSCGNNKQNAFITDGCGTPTSSTRKVYHILSVKVNGEVHKCVWEFLATFVAERIYFIMIKEYIVNNDQTRNPGLHHEVHTREHARQLFISNVISLGLCPDEIDAVVKAKRFYWDADGCAICCPRAHRG